MFNDLVSAEGLGPAPRAASRLPWIETRPGLPYFVTEAGEPWTPIGQNDSIAWVELAGLFRRKDVAAVEKHLRWLHASGVTVLRLMMECAHKKHRYLELSAGRLSPNMVQLWDDLFAMCERIGLRILLTPVDTFWTWIRWRFHPWNKANGGMLDSPRRLLTCPDTRLAIKDRLEFAVRRWGGSGALFAWDLWNEIHPAHGGDSAEPFPEFIADLSAHVRGLERELYGRSHPQTVSLFGPELWLKPDMELREPIYRHPDLDFASIHIYCEGTIDLPRNTVAPALDMARIVRESLAEIRDDRPFFDTEHGPIHAFKDKRRVLPAAFDDEYFRHIAWAHLASGGAGGGMRWPNRTPHTLTPGMREAQGAMSRFLPLMDWTRFVRRNLNEEVVVPNRRKVGVAACGDGEQALVWLVRRDTLVKEGRLARVDADAEPMSVAIEVPALSGRHRATLWDTRAGRTLGTVDVTDGRLTVPLATDLALAIARA